VTRQTILQEALRLIQEKGVEGWSLRELARAVDYSPAGLYEYFDSRDAILGVLASEGHLRFTRALRAVDTALPADEYLVQLGLAYLAFALHNTDYFLLMFTHQRMGDSHAQIPDDRDSYAVLVEAVRGAQAAGALPAGDAQGLAYLFWAFIHGVAMLQATFLRSAPEQTLLGHEPVVRTFVRQMSK
jgi:AcrR family transcriptional regulator